MSVCLGTGTSKSVYALLVISPRRAPITSNRSASLMRWARFGSTPIPTCPAYEGERLSSRSWQRNEAPAVRLFFSRKARIACTESFVQPKPPRITNGRSAFESSRPISCMSEAAGEARTVL